MVIKLFASTTDLDESVGLAEMKKCNPVFFKTKFVDNEKYKVYRGCLLVDFTRCSNTPRNVTVYISTVEIGLLYYCQCPDVEIAKMCVDTLLEVGDIRLAVDACRLEGALL